MQDADARRIAEMLEQAGEVFIHLAFEHVCFCMAHAVFVDDVAVASHGRVRFFGFGFLCHFGASCLMVEQLLNY